MSILTELYSQSKTDCLDEELLRINERHSVRKYEPWTQEYIHPVYGKVVLKHDLGRFRGVDHSKSSPRGSTARKHLASAIHKAKYVSGSRYIPYSDIKKHMKKLGYKAKFSRPLNFAASVINKVHRI